MHFLFLNASYHHFYPKYRNSETSHAKLQQSKGYVFLLCYNGEMVAIPIFITGWLKEKVSTMPWKCIYTVVTETSQQSFGFVVKGTNARLRIATTRLSHSLQFTRHFDRLSILDCFLFNNFSTLLWNISRLWLLDAAICVCWDWAPSLRFDWLWLSVMVWLLEGEVALMTGDSCIYLWG